VIQCPGEARFRSAYHFAFSLGCDLRTLGALWSRLSRLSRPCPRVGRVLRKDEGPGFSLPGNHSAVSGCRFGLGAAITQALTSDPLIVIARLGERGNVELSLVVVALSRCVLSI
jgi:hypothetical protein